MSLEWIMSNLSSHWILQSFKSVHNDGTQDVILLQKKKMG